ncbi:hypothetical protein, partial [Priestia sp. SB1]|uniref:hypothetical protein n=1 Tax=Priestia sp. SB1 TaxID=3132359 RepID=UPI00319DD906
MSTSASAICSIVPNLFRPHIVFNSFRLIFPEYNRNIGTFYIGKKENKLLITTNHYKASYIWDEVST